MTIKRLEKVVDTLGVNIGAPKDLLRDVSEKVNDNHGRHSSIRDIKNAIYGRSVGNEVPDMSKVKMLELLALCALTGDRAQAGCEHSGSIMTLLSGNQEARESSGCLPPMMQTVERLEERIAKQEKILMAILGESSNNDKRVTLTRTNREKEEVTCAALVEEEKKLAVNHSANEQVTDMEHVYTQGLLPRHQRLTDENFYETRGMTSKTESTSGGFRAHETGQIQCYLLTAEEEMEQVLFPQGHRASDREKDYANRPSGCILM